MQSYVIILTSGIEVRINSSKGAIDDIRNAVAGSTIGFESDGSFVQRDEIAAILSEEIYGGPKKCGCSKS